MRTIASAPRAVIMRTVESGSGTALIVTVAELSFADPDRPPSMVRSTKISKKLVTGKTAESDSDDENSVANVISVAGGFPQRVGVLPANNPPGQISSVAVTAPSPIALAGPSSISPSMRVGAVALNRKNA